MTNEILGKLRDFGIAYKASGITILLYYIVKIQLVLTREHRFLLARRTAEAGNEYDNTHQDNDEYKRHFRSVNCSCLAYHSI